jgi:multidrug resistance efflux pump
MGYKRILTRVTVVFVLLLLFLTFFSRTLVDMQLPRVSLAFIQSGVIAPEALSHGLVSPADTERIFSPIGGRITQIMGVGDVTNAGSVLFTLSVDVRTLYDQLDASHHEQRVIALNMERAQSDLENAQRQLTLIRGEPINTPNLPTLNLLEFDLQLTANANDTEAVREGIETLEALYLMGIIPRQQVTDRENDLIRLQQARESIYQRREQAIEAYEQALINHSENLEAATRTRNTQIRSQQNQITQLEFQIRALRLDNERVENRMENLMERIDEGGIYQVRLETGTPSNRVVTQILSGLDIGSFVAEGSPVMVTAIRNNRFTIEAAFPQSQDFIRPNQQVGVTVGNRLLEGTTARVVPQGGRNMVTINVESNELLGGESAWVTVRDRSANAPHIIPLSALRRHQTGYYILYVEAEEGWFGSRYYLQTMMVEPGRRDARNVAVSARHGQSFPQGPIVVNSDMPVSSGNRVRLVENP